MKAIYALLFAAGIVLISILINTDNPFDPKPEKTEIVFSNTPVITETGQYASMLVPAVDEQGEGLVTNLTVEVKQGQGKSLVDIDGLLFWVDTQNSIRTAKNVAEQITLINLDNYDITYSIVTNASAVEGPSAGAALALVTIAALENKKLKSNVMITGTIWHDGSIGRVGDVFAKARAAKLFGATTFLVPPGQSVETNREYKKKCKNFLISKVCSSDWETSIVNISDEVGIEVIEVENIEETLSYLVVQ